MLILYRWQRISLQDNINNHLIEHLIMKIALVQPNGRFAYSICPEPPLGLAYLASSLLAYDNDLDIEIIDGFIIEREENKLNNTQSGMCRFQKKSRCQLGHRAEISPC